MESETDFCYNSGDATHNIHKNNRNLVERNQVSMIYFWS